MRESGTAWRGEFGREGFGNARIENLAAGHVFLEFYYFVGQ